MSVSVKGADNVTIYLATGAGDGSTGSPYQSPLGVAVGAQADAPATADTGSFSLVALVKRGLAYLAGINAGAPNGATGQVTVDTTAGGVLVVAARAGRRYVTVENHTATPVFVGLGTGAVTPTTGFLLPGVVGASVTFGACAVKAVVASGTAVVSYAEEY